MLKYTIYKNLTLFNFSAPSLAVYGAAAGLFLIFFTSSWFGKNVMKHVPVYNKKYDEKDPEM